MAGYDEESDIARKRVVNALSHHKDFLDTMLGYLIDIRFPHIDQQIGKQFYEQRCFVPIDRELISLVEYRHEFVDPVFNYMEELEKQLTTTFPKNVMYVLYHKEQAHPALAVRSIARVDQMLLRERAMLLNVIRDNLDTMRSARNEFSLYICELRAIGSKGLNGFAVRDALDWIFKLFDKLFKIKIWMKEMLDKNGEGCPLYFIYPAKKVVHRQQHHSSAEENVSHGFIEDKKPKSTTETATHERRELQDVYRTLRTLKFTFDNEIIFMEKPDY